MSDNTPAAALDDDGAKAPRRQVVLVGALGAVLLGAGGYASYPATTQRPWSPR